MKPKMYFALFAPTPSSRDEYRFAKTTKLHNYNYNYTLH